MPKEHPDYTAAKAGMYANLLKEVLKFLKSLEPGRFEAPDYELLPILILGIESALALGER